MRRHRLPTVARHTLTCSAIALSVLLMGNCGTSTTKQRQIESAVNTFVSRWQQGDLQNIYYNADPQFRKISLQDWSSWKNNIDQRWGYLRKVNIQKIDRLAPIADVYQ